MLSKYGNCIYLLKTKNKLKIGCLTNKVRKNYQYFVSVFNKAKIPLVLAGYEMVDSQLGIMRLVGYLPSHIQCTLVKYLLTITFSEICIILQIIRKPHPMIIME